MAEGFMAIKVSLCVSPSNPAIINLSIAGKEFASGEVLGSGSVFVCKCVCICVCLCVLAPVPSQELTHFCGRGEFRDPRLWVSHSPIAFSVLFFLSEPLSSPITTARTVAGASAG